MAGNIFRSSIFGYFPGILPSLGFEAQAYFR